jgi:Flp pilus assembly protein TadG
VTGRFAMVRRAVGRRRRTEAGYAAILVSVLVPTVFLGLAAVGVDTARWYLEGEKIQLAADAAALAGVPYLPQDMPNARTRALLVAKRNGYDNASPHVVVTVEKGARESQLRVTISSRIRNQFGQLIGVDGAVITRTAVSDFTGPAPMGSPCNVFGTEPVSGGAAAAGVNGASDKSAIGHSRPGNCPQDPEFWATVEGPQTGKVQGDRYGTVKCESNNVDGCDSSKTNEEYTPKGYFWLIKVQPSMVNQPLSLQVYDPAFVRTGQFCNSNQLPSHDTLRSNMNDFVNNDGQTRYADVDTIPASSKPAVPFCTGDDYSGSATGAKTDMTTTFMVREQTDSQDPLQAPVQVAVTGQPCAKQFGSYGSYPSSNALYKHSGSYNANLAEVYHNWVELCEFRPERAGDYYLHVRTNKHHGFTGGQLSRTVPNGSLSSVAGEAGDSSPRGGGLNSFAIRAVTPNNLERGVAVSGWDRMPIFANSEAASTIFPLIRILPGAAGQSISFEFFDAGDATDTATVEVLLPEDARTPTGGPIINRFPNGCTSTGASAGTLQSSPSCTFTLTKSGGVSRNNGKMQTINIPIPPDYSCDATVFTNCWYRVRIGFSSGSVHDVTTWDAEIVGDPVRLIE